MSSHKKSWSCSKFGASVVTFDVNKKWINCPRNITIPIEQAKKYWRNNQWIVRCLNRLLDTEVNKKNWQMTEIDTRSNLKKWQNLRGCCVVPPCSMPWAKLRKTRASQQHQFTTSNQWCKELEKKKNSHEKNIKKFPPQCFYPAGKIFAFLKCEEVIKHRINNNNGYEYLMSK